MPTYEYLCKECDHDFEIVQQFTDAALTQCPKCTGELRKVYGNVGVVFKGSGFYATDNRTPGRAASGASGASAATADSPGANGANGSSRSAAADASGSTGTTDVPSTSGAATVSGSQPSSSGPAAKSSANS